MNNSEIININMLVLKIQIDALKAAFTPEQLETYKNHIKTEKSKGLHSAFSQSEEGKLLFDEMLGNLL